MGEAACGHSPPPWGTLGETPVWPREVSFAPAQAWGRDRSLRGEGSLLRLRMLCWEPWGQQRASGRRDIEVAGGTGQVCSHSVEILGSLLASKQAWWLLGDICQTMEPDPSCDVTKMVEVCILSVYALGALLTAFNAQFLIPTTSP